MTVAVASFESAMFFTVSRVSFERLISDRRLVSVLLHESGKVEGVARSEVLFHLVELISAHGVQISTLQLLCKDGRLIEIVEEASHTCVVILQQTVVLGILQMGVLGEGLTDVLLSDLRKGWEPHVLSKVVRHYYNSTIYFIQL